MVERVEKIVFFLIIFFISSQVGLHFWPEFSYVNGVRIDYLSPILYLIDILIRLLFILFAIRIKVWKIVLRLSPFYSIFFTTSFILFFLSLLWNSFNAESVGAHLYGITRLAQFVLFGIYIAYNFKENYIKLFVEVLAFSAIVSSVLAIWQFINQSSIGGLWYFFGERTFNSATIGISTVNLDQQILRAYAAFPHPNVLAFFLFMVVTFAIMRVSFEQSIKEKIFLTSTILVSVIAIFTTFSRSVIFLLISLSIYVIYTKGKRNVVRFGLISILIFVFLSLYFLVTGSQNFLTRGLDFRSELTQQAWEIFVSNPYFGIGLNNFFIHQASLVKNVSPILFQPPHNIYILVLLSLGLFGFWIFPLIIYGAAKSLIIKILSTKSSIKNFYISVLIVLFGILIAGLFDHYFLTLEQGQIIFALILGLSFSKLLPDTSRERKRKRSEKKT